jgi:hypothetical protein
VVPDLSPCHHSELSHAGRMYYSFSLTLGEDRSKCDVAYYHDGRTETTMHEFYIAYYKGRYCTFSFILYSSSRRVHIPALHVLSSHLLRRLSRNLSL